MLFAVFTLLAELWDLKKEGVSEYVKDTWNVIDLAWCACMVLAIGLEFQKVQIERNFKLIDWGSLGRWYTAFAASRMAGCTSSADPGLCYCTTQGSASYAAWITRKFLFFNHMDSYLYSDSVSGTAFIRIIRNYANASYITRVLHALGIVMSYVRCMKFYRHRGKLSLLPKTLSGASGDLGHFVVTFLIFMVGFTAASVLLFGHHPTAGFSDFFSGWISLTGMLFGSFNLDAMTTNSMAEIGQEVGYAYFLTVGDVWCCVWAGCFVCGRSPQ